MIQELEHKKISKEDLLPQNLLPHAMPMVFISNVISYSLEKKCLKSNVTIKDSDVFFDSKISGVPSYVGLEYMAQTIACFSGVYNLTFSPNKKSNIGLILGTRHFKTFIDVFSLNETYTIDINENFFDEEIASFECKIFNKDNMFCQEAVLNAYRPKDIKKFLDTMEN